jgi:hypothetical protein
VDDHLTPPGEPVALYIGFNATTLARSLHPIHARTATSQSLVGRHS